jgi:hypothetical protein
MAKEVVATAVAEYSRFEIESLERIREMMLSGIASERKMIGRLAEDADEETLEDLGSDSHFLDEAEELVGKLLIVGLYRVVENLTKQVLRHRFAEGKVKKCYQIEKLKELFTNELHADLTAIPHFAQIDEIRTLNNKVKHGGGLPERYSSIPLAASAAATAVVSLRFPQNPITEPIAWIGSR